MYNINLIKLVYIHLQNYKFHKKIFYITMHHADKEYISSTKCRSFYDNFKNFLI